MECGEIIRRLESLADPEAVKGMARYGINPQDNYGVSITNLRAMAKEIGRDHVLAQQLWDSGVRDARILASLIDDPKLVTEEQMDRWVGDLNSWDVCDGCCMNLFRYTDFAYRKALEWSASDDEFTKRAAFTLMATLAVHDKKAEDGRFEAFLPIIKREASDNRNYVRKAVNWALRQVGKRNLNLNGIAIETARDIQKLESKSAKWVASDAIRELTSDAIQQKLSRAK